MLIFTFQLHSQGFQAVTFSVEQWVSFFALGTIFSVVLDASNWIWEANVVVKEESGFACFTNSVYVQVAVYIHFLALIVSIQEKSLGTRCANWYLIHGKSLSQTVRFFQHAFSNTRNKIFFCTLITVSVIIVVLAVNIILDTGLSSFEVESNRAQDTLVSNVFGAVLNHTLTLGVHFIRISASEATVSQVSFGFCLLKLLTVWNRAFSIDFLEGRFTILASAVLVNASRLLDVWCWFVIFILFDQVTAWNFASIIWSQVITWSALFFNFNLQIFLISALIVQQPKTILTSNTFQTLVLNTICYDLDVAYTFSWLIHVITLQCWTLSAFTFIINQTSWFVRSALSVFVKVVVLIALNTSIGVLDFAFCYVVHHLLCADFRLEANAIVQLESEFAILWFCNVRSTLGTCPCDVVFFTSNDGLNTLVIIKLEPFSTCFTIRSVLDHTSIQYVSFALVTIEVKTWGAFGAETIEASLHTTLIDASLVVWNARSINILIIAVLTNFTFTIKMIGSTTFNKIEGLALIIYLYLSEVTIGGWSCSN